MWNAHAVPWLLSNFSLVMYHGTFIEFHPFGMVFLLIATAVFNIGTE